MAALPEDDTFPSEITQIETTEPVIGGVSGVSNRALIQLARRTRWLKNRVDSLIDGGGGGGGGDGVFDANGDFPGLRARATTKTDVGLGSLNDFPIVHDPGTGTAEQYASGQAVKTLFDLITGGGSSLPTDYEKNEVIRSTGDPTAGGIVWRSQRPAFTANPLSFTAAPSSGPILGGRVNDVPQSGAFTIPAGWYLDTTEAYPPASGGGA